MTYQEYMLKPKYTINIDRKEKIEEILKEVQKGCSARTVSYRDIVKRLSEIKVPKSLLHGTEVVYENSDYFAKAYWGVPMSTQWKAENHHGTWYITDISRNRCPNRAGQNEGYIRYSEEAKKWILKDAAIIKY